MSIQNAPAQAVVSAETPTVVGVDLGVRNLAVAAPADAPASVDDALVVDGDLVRALYDELGAVTRRLQLMPGETAQAEARAFCWYYERLMECFASAAARVLAYLDAQDADAIVLEELSYSFTPLTDCRRGETDAGSWVMPGFQRRLEAACAAAGYRVEYVDPEFTTQECHLCGVHGDPDRGGLRCINDACPVDVECRDKSAAVSIAKRSIATMEGM